MMSPYCTVTYAYIKKTRQYLEKSNRDLTEELLERLDEMARLTLGVTSSSVKLRVRGFLCLAMLIDTCVLPLLRRANLQTASAVRTCLPITWSWDALGHLAAAALYDRENLLVEKVESQLAGSSSELREGSLWQKGHELFVRRGGMWCAVGQEEKKAIELQGKEIDRIDSTTRRIHLSHYTPAHNVLALLCKTAVVLRRDLGSTTGADDDEGTDIRRVGSFLAQAMEESSVSHDARVQTAFTLLQTTENSLQWKHLR
jgi:hypothetical protein